MILDSSAIIAILLREPGFETVLEKIAEVDNLSIGAPTLAETGIVLGNRVGENARAMLTQFVYEWRIAVIPFGERHWTEAVNAYMTFGKGRHKAGLNFGDCMTFAVVRLSGQPLLCTGKDFSKTNLTLA